MTTATSNITAFISMGALLCGIAFAESAPPAPPDLSGKTDASIRDVLRVVARRQLSQFGPLKDGDYTAIDSLAAAEAARKLEGIGWSYPWGVTLYGVIRSTDATGDTEMLNWALEHNRIIARYYAWLETVRQKTNNAEAWTAFIRDNKKVKTGGLLRLGNLDSCGAMGVQYLEGMLRRTKGRDRTRRRLDLGETGSVARRHVLAPAIQGRKRRVASRYHLGRRSLHGLPVSRALVSIHRRHPSSHRCRPTDHHHGFASAGYRRPLVSRVQ